MAQHCFVGIDVGTSGVRAAALAFDEGDDNGRCLAMASAPLPAPLRDPHRPGHISQDPALWAVALDACLDQLHRRIDPASVRALAIDGTSGTVLLTDASGTPLGPALMYNDSHAATQGERVNALAPADSPARGAATGLARMLALLDAQGPAAHALHQADWLVGRLRGRFGDSDENNALKTGYDPVARCWPRWMNALDLPAGLLPRVHPPGTSLGTVGSAAQQRHGWRADTQLMAGTTDGVAAFLATGAQQVGDAVTSLGSTLVIKILSAHPVADPACGIYSHRLGALWLPGGASNAGGASLLPHFSPEQMQALTPLLKPDEPTGLDYYPLPAPGERFPVNDPTWPSRTTPRSADDARFFQGLLEGLTTIEAQAYARLQELGAPPPRSLRTVGGGSTNPAWMRLRERALKLLLLPPAHTEAACGSARLAAGRLPLRAST
jgi:D-ribulokinase